MATEPATRPPVEPHPPRRRTADIRARRSPILTASALRALVRRTLSIVTLVFLDVAGLTLGLYSALAVRELYYGRTPLWGLLWDAAERWLPFLVLVTVLVFWRAGMYASRDRRGGFGRVLSSLVLVGLLALAFAVGAGHEGFRTYGLAPTAVIAAAVCVGVLRGTYESLTQDVLRIAGVRRRVLLVGDAEQVAHLHRTLGFGRRGISYEFVGAVTESLDEPVPIPLLGTLDDVTRALDETRVDELVVTEADLDEQALLDLVEQAHRRGVKVRVAPKTTQLLVQHAEYVPDQGVPLFELRPPAFAGVDWAVKRSFDVAVSAAILLAGLPLWLLIALAIKLDTRGPVLFRDRRVGLHEHEFLMLKFRTMHVGAAEAQPLLEARNEADGPLFKIRDDPRVTRVGAFLRRFSIDEIPQVLNVLRGEMSLVGPRPLPVRDFLQLQDWHRKRYLVLPGMTGLWQVSGRSGLSFDDLVRLDFYYLENWSMWLDISILAKTIPAVVAARGAY
ncbi:MAG TPA: sugar transferase [Gaiellaceae bacterium]|nr:sugar transferase [Gaiellaceae bacterium]